MNIRTKAREAALQALYQMDMANGTVLVCISSVCEGLDLTPEAREYGEALFFGAVDRREEINRVIEGYSKNWTVERMPVIDRNVLRIAVYELLYCPGVPYRVVIDEAVELAKRFGSGDSGAFVNGILDSLAKDIATKRVVSAH
ncbi:MAG: transcription antitermination factor NusB [Deltaproteobacteria bacterium]|nr:transcription antitermination factor NusB [Deltaproteobacteria bacterium]